MTNAWTYEQLVKEIYENLLKQDGLSVHHRRTYVGKRSNQPYEIDVSFEFSKAAVTFLVLVECKYYSRPVEVGDILELAYKVQDVGAQKGILVSTIGFQKGVFNIAQGAGIALVIIKEPGTFDVLMSSRGPKVYFDIAFSDYEEAENRGEEIPVLAIIHSVQADGQSIVNPDSLFCAKGRRVDLCSFGSLVNVICEVRQEDSKELIERARLCRRRREFEDAERLARHALSIRERQFGPEDLQVAEILNLLAVIYEDQNRHLEAEPVCRRALAIRERLLQSSDSFLAESLNNLGALYEGQGRYLEAEPLLKRALESSQQSLGREHVLVGAGKNNLARVYWKLKKYAEAESLLGESIAIMEKVFGQNHENVAKVLVNLADLFRETGRAAAADEVDARVHRIRSQGSFG